MIDFELNGRRVQVDAPDETPLLWVLRDELGLTGTKFGCGKSLCGACTVHLDGAPARSCQLPLSGVAGRKITTIEGLDGRVAVAVQKAWDTLQVVQCGYCQSGQVMAATGAPHDEREARRRSDRERPVGQSLPLRGPTAASDRRSERRRRIWRARYERPDRPLSSAFPRSRLGRRRRPRRRLPDREEPGPRRCDDRRR
jgi:isoquinoline 1-oxidoreductase alpha subunit